MYGWVMSQNLPVGDFFKLMSNVVFGNNGKCEKIWDIRFGNSRTNRIIWYHTQKIFSEYLLAMEMKKKEIFMGKPIYFRPGWE